MNTNYFFLVVIFLFSLVMNAQNDEQALINLYNITNGGSWEDDTNWLSSEPINEWHGVEATQLDGGQWIVTSLVLPNNNLEGNLAELIAFGFSLPSLTHLDVSDNCLSLLNPLGFPVSFASISTNLSYIDLSNNKFNIEIPNFDELSGLVHLDLSHNEIHGTIPSLNLPNLNYLNLASNQLEGSIPSDLNNLSELAHLDLSVNNFVSNINDLSNLNNLTYLDLHDNDFEGNIENLSNLNNLISLYLGNNNFEGYIDDLSNLVKLNHLDLIDNNFEGSIPSDLTNLSKLNYLRLAFNKLEGNIPNLSTLSNLIHLDLSANNFEGDIPSNLSNLFNLQYLDLGFNQLSGSIPDLSTFSNLKDFRVSNNQLSGVIPIFANEPPNLNSFQISNNNFIFSDLLNNFDFVLSIPECDINFSNCVSYAPQAKVPIYEESNMLFVEVGGDLAQNHYTWYKDEAPMENMPITGNNTLTVTESGEYYVEATNDILTQSGDFKNLVLVSESLFIEIPDNCIDPFISEQDFLALEEFYKATNGPNWVNNEGWMTDAPLEDWYGITLNEDCRVSSISLVGNNLAGGLIDLNLPFLTDLRLGSNQLSGTIPDFQNLANLQRLFLNENQLTGSIPSFSNLPNIQTISLFMNNLVGSIPTSFSEFTSLRLSVRNNQLSGTIPPLPNLNSFFIQHNNFIFSDILNTWDSVSDLCSSICLDYSPQAKIGTAQIDTINGTPFQAVVSAGGEDTEYQWYKSYNQEDEVLVGTGSTFSIPDPQASDVGIYTCVATNPTLENLTLISEPQILMNTPKVYTIHQNAEVEADYQAIQEAINDLGEGIALDAPIILNILEGSGIYDEPIAIPSFEESSIFVSITLNGNEGVTITNSAANEDNPAVIQIEGTDYINFNNLNIVNSENACSWGIHLRDEAENVKIRNCTITNPIDTNNVCFAGIVASNNNSSFLAEDAKGLNANSTIIDSCTITGGYAGIMMVGAVDTTMFGGYISNNLIETPYAVGIESNFSNGCSVINNQVKMGDVEKSSASLPFEKDRGIVYKCVTARPGVYGKAIDIEEAKKGREVRIENNRVSGSFYRGIEVTDTYRTSEPSEYNPPFPFVVNNCIEGILDTISGSAGIYFDKARDINCYHNSVEVTTLGISDSSSVLFIKNSEQLSIFNNSLAHEGMGYSVFIEDNSSITWDYNNYYVNPETEGSPVLIHYDGLEIPTLDILQASFGNENSISTPNKFTFFPDDTSPLLNNASMDIASLIPFDFEGDSRPPAPFDTSPDIGYNEFIVKIIGDVDVTVSVPIGIPIEIPIVTYDSPSVWKHIYEGNSDSLVISITSTNTFKLATEVYLHNPEKEVRQTEDGTYYLDRNYRLTTSSKLTSDKDIKEIDNIKIRFYISQRELDRVIDIDSNIESFEDINLTYTAGMGSDLSAFTAISEPIFFKQMNSEQIAANVYLLEYELTNITELGEFWLHGGTEPLVVGIEDTPFLSKARLNFQIAPNPFQNNFEIQIQNSITESAELQIFDLTGRKVYQQTLQLQENQKNYVISLPSFLQSGLHVLGLETEKHRGYTKILRY